MRLTVLIFQSVGSCTIALYGLQAVPILHEHTIPTTIYGPSIGLDYASRRTEREELNQ